MAALPESRFELAKTYSYLEHAARSAGGSRSGTWMPRRRPDMAPGSGGDRQQRGDGKQPQGRGNPGKADRREPRECQLPAGHGPLPTRPLLPLGPQPPRRGRSGPEGGRRHPGIAGGQGAAKPRLPLRVGGDLHHAVPARRGWKAARRPTRSNFSGPSRSARTWSPAIRRCPEYRALLARCYVRVAAVSRSADGPGPRRKTMR